MLDISLSSGNKKLVPSNDTNFIIFNIPSRVTCPYATELCKKYYYAVKAEKVYPEVLPSRQRNFEASKSVDFVREMSERINRKLKNQRKEKLVVRIHESGDFYNKEYAMKWLQIARNCPSATFMAYTKSFKYFDGVKLPKNFMLRASIWADTSEEQKEIVKRNKWTTYSAVESFTENDKFFQCRCADCATCGKCWSKEKHICCEIH